MCIRDRPVQGEGGGSGLVTEIDSELIPYLDAAIIALENDGTIQALFDELSLIHI